MNNLTSGQRKMVYGLGIMILMGFVIWLGAPSSGSPGSGGKVSQLREQHGLGEATLGNVDPTSSTMNLVLLGFRGIAASILWSDAEFYRATKNWSQLQQTADSITLLQPHFKKVWEYQAWNLGFNVSAECDAVEDRYYWVKQGAKYLIRGTTRNKKFPELEYECGRFFGQKIGRSDEKEQFRKYFLQDPDTARWKGKADGDINPEGIDNHLVAKQWYLKANDSVETKEYVQHKMDDALFRAYPYHAQMDYAADREGDGIFDDTSLQAWKDAYIDWTVKYGQKRFTAAGIGVVFTMEGTRKDFEKMAREERLPPLPGKIEDPTTVALEIESLVKEKLNWQDRYHSTSNYKYWKLRCQAEQESEMRDVREKLYYGKRKLTKEGVPDEARPLLEAGHLGLQKMIDKFGLDEWGESKLMENDEILLEDTLKSLLIYERVCEGLPAGDFPLKSVWVNPKYQKQREELREKFIKKYGAG